MPLHYTIDSRGVVHTTARGCVTGEELVTHGGALFEDPAVRQPYAELCDLRGVERCECLGAHVQTLAAGARRFHARFPRGRLAIVTGTDAAYGMARVYMSYAAPESFRIELFRQDLAAARVWLGLEPAA